MKKLFPCVDEFIRQSGRKDLARLKLCLGAVGVLIGLGVSETKRPCASFWAKTVFLFSFIPLMKKFFVLAAEECSCREQDAE